MGFYQPYIYMAMPRQTEFRDGSEQHEPFNPSLVEGMDLPFTLFPETSDVESEEENAAGDYLATIEHAANALREQGFEPNERIIIHPRGHGRLTFPLVEGRIDENGNYEFSTRIGITTQDVDRWRQEEERIRECETDTCSTRGKLPLMDRKYPHVCFQCKKELKYRHAYNQACDKYNIYRKEAFDIPRLPNLSGMSPDKALIKDVKKSHTFEKQFRKWWRSKYVQFLCCDCFRGKSTEQIWHDINHVALSGGFVITGSEHTTREITLDDLERELDSINHEEP
jgi:hypothetical protein